MVLKNTWREKNSEKIGEERVLVLSRLSEFK